MQDKIVARPNILWLTCVLAHIHTNQLRCVLCTEINMKHKHDIHFQSIIYSNIINMVYEVFCSQFFYLSSSIPTYPEWVLQKKLQVDRSLHKAMGLSWKCY